MPSKNHRLSHQGYKPNFLLKDKDFFMLNRLWFGFFAVAFFFAFYHFAFLNDVAVWQRLVQTTFEMSKSGVEIALGLIGTLAFWLGLLKVGEAAGLVRLLAKVLAPFFEHMLPDIPKGHPALGQITMNMAANILGLDNAATPIGLKAMSSMQEVNPKKDTASNAQICFLVINTSSVMLLPVTIFLYRAQMGAPDPARVYVPILLATSFSTFVGFLSVAFVQKLPVWNKVVLSYIAAFIVIITSLTIYFIHLPNAAQTEQSALLGNMTLFGIIVLLLSAGFFKKVPVYDVFIEGAKEGFAVGVKLIPYLVAMLVGVGLLRECGMLGDLLQWIKTLCRFFNLDSQFVDALPTAFMKPFSGSAARAMMIDAMQQHGVDSFAALTAATIQGSSETTFYILAVYFGSVNIKHFRHAIFCGLLADVAGIIAAIFVSYLFFN